MIEKSEIAKQLDFLQKDRVQVQSRLDKASDEVKQLERTLNSLDGAIQVSNQYLNMIEEKETAKNDGTIKSSKVEKVKK